MIKNCQQCKVDYKTDDNRRKFCSEKCYWEKSSANPNKGTFKKGQIVLVPFDSRCRGSANPKWKGGQLEKVCKICSKQFLVDRDRDDAKTCSLDCHKFYVKTEEFRMRQSEIIRSNINQDLKHLHNIVSKFKNLLRRCSKYNMWREKVFNRDDFTCQMCGVRGGKICADHIKPFIVIISENGIESYEDAIKCKELWNVDNGRILCLPCHYKTPTFGSKVLQTLSIKRN